MWTQSMKISERRMKSVNNNIEDLTIISSDWRIIDLLVVSYRCAAAPLLNVWGYVLIKEGVGGGNFPESWDPDKDFKSRHVINPANSFRKPEIESLLPHIVIKF